MKKLSKLFVQQNGSVTIEMAFVILGFVFLLSIMVDFGIVMLKQSKLERTNASLASVFREREALYRQNNTLTKFQAEAVTQADTNQLGQLAIRLLNEPNLSMRIDAIYFTGEIVLAELRTDTFNFGSKPCAQGIPPLRDSMSLSPYSELNRWMPLYRISICIPGSLSWYQKIISPDTATYTSGDVMMVSNVVIPR